MMKNLLDLRVFCALFALWSIEATARFLPVNGGMANQQTIITTSGGTTTAVATSNQVFVFEGTQTQSFKLPDATKLPIDWWYNVVNNSTGTVTIKDNSGATVKSVLAGEPSKIQMSARASAAGTWKVWPTIAQSSIFLKSDFISSSSGSGSANLPVKTNGSGILDFSLFGASLPLTTKGDILAFSTSATRLPVGADGLVLTTDSAQAFGLKWAVAGASNITALTGDGSASGPGSAVLTLATVNGNVGSFTNGSFTVNGKGLITAAASGTAPVTSLSVATANGFAGSSSGGATPALTLSTTISGSVCGNGTAVSACTTTGSGSTVLASSPTLVTPVLGVATATSINKMAITAPATSSTLAVADGKTFTSSNTLTLAGTDSSTLNIGTGGTLGTLAFLSDPLAVNKGGTGLATLTAHSIQIGNGASTPTQLAVPASGTLLTGVASSDPAFSATPTLGVAGATTGKVLFAGSSSGTVTLTPANAAGTWTFTLPSTAGSNTNVLQTDGSGITSWVAVPTAAPRSEVTVDSGNGYGAVNTKIRRFTNTRKSTGSNITYADSANSGASFVVNAAGVYGVTYDDTTGNLVGCQVGISVNNSAGTTNFESLTYAQGLRTVANTGSAGTQDISVHWDGILASGDTVTVGGNGNCSDTAGNSMATVVQISN